LKAELSFVPEARAAGLAVGGVRNNKSLGSVESRLLFGSIRELERAQVL